MTEKLPLSDNFTIRVTPTAAWIFDPPRQRRTGTSRATAADLRDLIDRLTILEGELKDAD